MRRRGAIILILGFAVALAACRRAPTYSATVELQIDGKAHDYETTRAQVDQQVRGGRYSLYLLPEDPEATTPYLCLRTYAGNPVAHLWVRYAPPAPDGGEAADLKRYECFVPGTLSNGTATLSWKRDTGEPRDKTESGQEDCHAMVGQEGDQLVMSFEALLHREGGESAKDKKVKGDSHKAEGEAPKPEGKGPDTIQVKGRAVLSFGAPRS